MKTTAIRVRRAREQVPPSTSTQPLLLPLLDELRRPEGRTILERMIRQLGPRRNAMGSALSAGWRHPDSRPVSDNDVAALLEEHGLTRAFERRERTLLLHALRAARGARPRAAAQIGISTENFQQALERLGVEKEAEAIREEWRSDIRRRTTLSEQVRLLVTDEERLTDLGILDPVLADLRARLPEHLKALRSAELGPLAPALGRSLSLSRSAIEILARRFALDLDPRSPITSRSRERAPVHPRRQTGTTRNGRYPQRRR